jgi:EAL domain-containing protein (putative c-di-GMP-specific phosphodiesterase class I)/GGDEF domain-containing protein
VNVWGGVLSTIDEAGVVSWRAGARGQGAQVGAPISDGIDPRDRGTLSHALTEARGGLQAELVVRGEKTGRLILSIFHDAELGLVAITRPWGRWFGDNAFRSAVQVAMDRGTPPYAVVVVDLADLRSVSGAFGHARVNDLIAGACDRIAELLGPMDDVWPIGRKELGVLLVDADEARARQVGTAISAALASGVRVAGHFLRLRTEVGVATARERYRRAEELISAAESTLGSVPKEKGSGPGVFKTGVGAEMRRLLRLTAGLSTAIERDEMSLVYQPIVDLRHKRISGFEVLSRWTHGELGPISPGEFVPIAEQMDLQGELDDWVLRRACAEVSAWEHEPTLSVNVSGRHADDLALVDGVQQKLRETGFPAARLRLEVTETAVVRNPADCREVVAGLQAGGIGVAMDDFGTGYASFRQLADLRVDVLKIDRSFVMSIVDDERQRQIVNAVITMCHKLGMRVVAEGVETAEQVALLDKMGCDYVQGFYFARPLPPDEARARSGEPVRW